MNKLSNFFLTRYRPRYLRSLVYMLQACDYELLTYLEWYHRTSDFAHVEKRKHLVKTPVARALIGWLWAMVLVGLLWLAAWFLVADGSPVFRLLVGLWVVLAAPIILAYGLTLPILLGKVLVQFPRNQLATRRVRRRVASHPAVRIGVAGSFGKTTMKEILATVIAAGCKVAATPGNLNTAAGIDRFVGGLAGDEEVLIFELGEYYPGDITRLCHLTYPQQGVITGINEAHIERFKTLDRTVGTIYELADYVGNDQVLVNGESPLVTAHIRPGNREYTRTGLAGWKVTAAKTSLTGTSFVASQGKLRIQAKSALLGLHQVGPLLAAIEVAHGLGMTPKQIEAGLSQTAPFDHRMQPLTVGDYTIIDDSYNGNPDGARVGIEFLIGLSGHHRTYVTPGLKEVEPQKVEVHQRIGRLLAESGIERVILVRNSATPAIAEGLELGGFKGQLLWYDDGPASFAAIPQLAKAGDVVFLQNDWSDHFA